MIIFQTFPYKIYKHFSSLIVLFKVYKFGQDQCISFSLHFVQSVLFLYHSNENKSATIM